MNNTTVWLQSYSRPDEQPMNNTFRFIRPFSRFGSPLGDSLEEISSVAGGPRPRSERVRGCLADRGPIDRRPPKSCATVLAV